MIITLIVLFFFGTSQTANPWFYGIAFSALLLFSFVSGFIHWLTFRYQLDDQELHIKHGLIFRKKRYIHQDRVQSIDLNAKLIQRLFNLVEVKIETAGGGEEPEFRIVALNKEEAGQIRYELLHRKAHFGENEEQLSPPEDSASWSIQEDEDKVKDEVDYRWGLSTKRLVIAAITSSGIGVAATFVAAIFSQIQQFVPESWYETAAGFVLQSSLILLISFVVLVLLIGWLIRIISTILKYGQFKIEKTGSDVVISRGVLEQRQLTINTQRITAIRLVQNMLRQPFGYASVYLETAGGGTKDEDLSTILIPLCKESEVRAHLQEIAPDFAFERPLTRLPKKSMKRYMVRLTVPVLLAAAVATYFVDYGAYSLIAIGFALGLGYWQYKDAGIGVNDHFLWMRTRKVVRTTVIVPRKRIQSVEITSNPLQRMDELTTIEVSILTSILGKTFSLKHLSENQAMKYFQWYSYEKEKQIRS